MSDLDRLLKLAGREAQQVAQSPAVDREMKEAAPENKKMVCKDCGDEMGHPTSDCENSAYDKDGDHWIEVDIDGDGEADIKVAADMADESVEEAVGDSDSVRNIDSILTSMNADHPGDIIADILHWCDAKNEDFNDLIRRGTDYYRDEKEMAGDMDESSMSDEEKEKAMKRAMQSADEPERGEKRKKVSVSKAPWESLEEDDLDENAFNQAAAAASRAGKSEFEFNGKKYKTKMDKSTAHQLDDDIQFESEELEESSCGCCGNDPCDCASDCGCKTESVNEAPTMDTTQMVIMMKNAGLSEEAIQTKLNEWANSPADASELEQTSHGEAYDFAQNVNLSLKRYLDAQDMKVQVSEHTVENMKSLYESKKNK